MRPVSCILTALTWRTAQTLLAEDRETCLAFCNCSLEQPACGPSCYYCRGTYILTKLLHRLVFARSHAAINNGEK